MPGFEFIVRSFPAPLEVFPVRNEFASSRSRGADSTSSLLPHTSIQRKMQFRLHFVRLGSGPRAHSATRGFAPQTDTLVDDRQCPLAAPGYRDTRSLVFFSGRTADDR